MIKLLSLQIDMGFILIAYFLGQLGLRKLVTFNFIFALQKVSWASLYIIRFYLNLDFSSLKFSSNIFRPLNTFECARKLHPLGFLLLLLFLFFRQTFSLSLLPFFCVVFFIFRYHFVLPFSNGIFLVCPYVTQPAFPALSIPILLFPSPCLALCVVCATMFKSFVGALPCNVIQLRPKMWQHFAARIVAFTTSVPYVCVSVCVLVCVLADGLANANSGKKACTLSTLLGSRINGCDCNGALLPSTGPTKFRQRPWQQAQCLPAFLLPSPLFLSLSVSFTRIVPLFGNYAARFNYDNSSERRSDNGKRQLQTKTSENATLRFLQLTWLQFAALLPAAAAAAVSSV